MKSICLGTIGIVDLDMNLYIQLQPKDSNFIKPYKNIVIQYEEEQLTIPVEQLFKKLKELFKENKDE